MMGRSMYGQNQLLSLPRRATDPRVGQWWRDILYGARSPRPPFDPAPTPPPEEPTPIEQTPFGGAGPVSRPRPSEAAVEAQRRLLDALRGRPGQSPVSDILIVRLPATVTCVAACSIYAQPSTASVVAQLGAGTRLTRVGTPFTTSDGAGWIEITADVTDNFNVRTVRGFVRLGELQEGGVLAPPPLANGGGPPIQTTPGGAAMAAPSILQTAGQVLLLTSPAWGAFLLSRFFR